MTSRGVVASGVTGRRKAGTDVAATIDDQWHLGSDTKAMTAVIIATFVERGKLTWETTLGDVFTELAAGFPSDFRAITVTQLLSHYAGLPAKPCLAADRSIGLDVVGTASQGAQERGDNHADIATWNEVRVLESRLRYLLAQSPSASAENRGKS